MNILKERARQQGANLAHLVEILETRRPYDTAGERAFIKKHLDFCHFDECGNGWYIVGDNPTVMWSSHTDTVTSTDGRQSIMWDNNVIRLNGGKPGQCLGADDGAGMWLMIEMIKAKIPGLYVFHRGEERGGIGSSWIVKNTPKLVDGIKYAIAFDRRSTGDVITHQAGGRCCSDAFAKALSMQLNRHPALTYTPDNTGVFTDTANYTELIPECTNLSVGYYNEHGPRESLDVAHLLNLREAILKIDVAALPCERDPSVIEYDDYYGGWGWHRSYNKDSSTRTELYELCKKYPYLASGVFERLGWDVDDLSTALFDGELPEESDDALAFCESCQQTFKSDFLNAEDGEQCPWCLSYETWAVTHAAAA